MPDDLRFPSRTAQPMRHERLSRDALSRLIPLWPKDVLDDTLEGRQLLVAKLERALAAERRRARSRSHAYDLARHAQLAKAWRAERDALRTML